MLTLYGTEISSPTNKIRYLLNYIGTTYDFKVINLFNNEQNSEEFIAINPFGKVPAIKDGKFCLAESNTIIRYIAKRYQSALYSENMEISAIIDQWMDFISYCISIPMSKITYNTYFYKARGIQQDMRALSDGRDMLAKHLPMLDSALQKQYVCGSNITIADFSLLSAFDIIDFIDCDIQEFRNINRFLSEMKNNDFYSTCNFKQHFTDAINKYCK